MKTSNEFQKVFQLKKLELHGRHATLCLWLNWIEYQTTDLRVESSNLSKHEKNTCSLPVLFNLFLCLSFSKRKRTKKIKKKGMKMFACLAQLVEHRFCKPTVIGSSPIVSTFFKQKNYERYIKTIHKEMCCCLFIL